MSPILMGNDVIFWRLIPDTPNTPPILRYELSYEGGHCNPTEQQLHMPSGNDSAILMSVSFTKLELDKGANYTVRVRAVNAFTSGDWSPATVLHTQRNR